MRLALIGKSIAHSQSPKLYQHLIGNDVEYSLLDIPNDESLPKVCDLAKSYDGVNITSPYKKHYISEVYVANNLTNKLGAINTISFQGTQPIGINTDLVAIRELLLDYSRRYKKMRILLLGGGVMARATVLVAQDLGLDIDQFERAQFGDLTTLNLRSWSQKDHQTMVINACSRDFIFTGETSGEEIFWDYNYHHIPHQRSLPLKFREYHDGLEMLYLQAKAAVSFWSDNKG